ncbi:DNA cytosine methyltransferase [Sinorhizobium meliloti]|nr:DNA cytosine methyltransferase [Sinorhizobium meliloti]
MPAYYNEFDPYAAQWLRNLISAGHIAPGDVDERSIEEVSADDLKEYTQCHFFAGIGGWSLALRLSGWADDRPAWTGSCPCQPLSSAGQQRGHEDDRHLWPAFFRLIAKRKPSVVFGEQVASADGREWFAAVRADMESVEYACGAADLCSAGVGAPHVRQRLYWLADANGGRRTHQDTRLQARAPLSLGRGRSGILGDPDRERLPEQQCDGRISRETGGAHAGQGSKRASPSATNAPGEANGFWRNADWLACRDGKWRPVEPGTFPLAHGVPGRVGRLRAYGNAITPEVGSEFITAYMDIIGG